AFKFLRVLFQNCSCADIEIVKGSRRGCARLRFRTEKGRTDAIKILHRKDIKCRNWAYEVNDGVADDDEEEI
ncbi:hypothetical protein Tco_1464226, partial [Tanacetum coccineum]